ACGQGRGGIGYQPYSRFWDAGPTRFGSGTTPTFSTLPPAALEYFVRRFGDRVDVMTSGTEWTDFIGFDSGKGSALADYGRALGISPNEMMAFGDNENDRDMLNVVGHPYLMESCNPSMRGINDRVRYVRTVEEELRRLLAE
ncbi:MULTISPECIES: HAD family hydrolase, partial [unclassified Collinsella]|uniref:HAD family hydrolase n=1 Tax=unclassified Collinsella TaxID=2637548 RepID=UPI003F9304C6